ncbi:MAG: ZIP family metal transporter, partial [Clostridiales bacterium]|nr:ZIP family metal transporter [Clostridiales bacterium]
MPRNGAEVSMLMVIIVSLAAGMFGTGLGGIIGAFLRAGDKHIGRLMAFAGGAMAGAACFELIPESIEIASGLFAHSGAVIGILSVIFGCGAVFVINKLIDFVVCKAGGVDLHAHGHASAEGLFHSHKELTSEIEPSQERPERETGVCGSSYASCDLDAPVTVHADGIGHTQGPIADADGARSAGAAMKGAGLLMLIAIIMHNFPEGAAIGSAGSVSESLSIVLAVVVAAHNVPAGFAISVPLVAGGAKRLSAILLTALAGAATAAGAVAGYFLGGLSSTVSSVLLGISGGAMLYATFGEIMQQSARLNNGKIPAAW